MPAAAPVLPMLALIEPSTATCLDPARSAARAASSASSAAPTPLPVPSTNCTSAGSSPAISCALRIASSRELASGPADPGVAASSCAARASGPELSDTVPPDTVPPDAVPQPRISAYTGRPLVLASAVRIRSTAPQPSPGRKPVGLAS